MEEEEIILELLLPVGVPLRPLGCGTGDHTAAGEANSTWLVPKAMGEDAVAQKEQAT